MPMKLAIDLGLCGQGFGAASSINTNPRNIASNVRAPGEGSGSLSNGTNTTQNLRSSHFNDCGVQVTGLALLYSGWALTTTNEADLTNNYTVTASIEYPSGTFTQVTWSAATSKLITPGDNIVSDYISVTIPDNTQFWVRTFVSVNSTEKWPLCSTLHTATELGEFGVGLTDKTMGGTISGTATGLRPAAILSQYVVGMCKVSLAGVGDSIINGSGDGAFDSHDNTSWIGRAATLVRCPYMQCAVVGTSLANQIISNKMTRRLDMLTKAGITHIVTNYGTNDGGVGSSTMETNLGTLWTTVRAGVTGLQKLYHTTFGPKSNSTDNVYTVANQTPVTGFNGSSDTYHVVNDWLRTIPSGIDGLFDNSDQLSTSRYSGLWKTGDSNADANLLTSENLTCSGSPTTTSVPTNSVRGSHWYQNSHMDFTSGVLSGTSDTGTHDNATSTISFTTPLASAPSAGDTLTARPSASRSSADSNPVTHPLVATNNATANSGKLFGGHIILRDYVVPIIQTWL